MIRKLIVSMVFVAATALMSMAAPPSWEHVQAPPVQIVEIVTPESATEVVVAEGYVYGYGSVSFTHLAPRANREGCGVGGGVVVI